jgi:hypothetical protein
MNPHRRSTVRAGVVGLIGSTPTPCRRAINMHAVTNITDRGCDGERIAA